MFIMIEVIFKVMMVVVVAHQLGVARAMVRQVRAEVAARGVSTSRILGAPLALGGFLQSNYDFVTFMS